MSLVRNTVLTALTLRRPLRTDLKREVGARRLRFESSWRDQNVLAFRFNQLEKDYFNLLDDFDILARVVRTLAGNLSSNVRRCAIENLELDLARRRVKQHPANYHPDEARLLRGL